IMFQADMDGGSFPLPNTPNGRYLVDSPHFNIHNEHVLFLDVSPSGNKILVVREKSIVLYDIHNPHKTMCIPYDAGMSLPSADHKVQGIMVNDADFIVSSPAGIGTFKVNF